MASAALNPGCTMAHHLFVLGCAQHALEPGRPRALGDHIDEDVAHRSFMAHHYSGLTFLTVTDFRTDGDGGQAFAQNV